VPRVNPNESVPPYGLNTPPFEAAWRVNGRRCRMAGTTYQRRVQVGVVAPLVAAASPQASTACLVNVWASLWWDLVSS
jgi:hypothetical protein